MSDEHKVKLTDALKDQQPKLDGDGKNAAHPELQPEEPHPSAMKQHNAQVNEGLSGNKERLVDIGRGEQTAGRQSS